MANGLVTIYRFHGSEEAYLWKAKLAASGIKATVVNDFNTGAALPENELKVRRSDVSKAKKILEPLKKPRSAKISRASAWMLLVFGIIFLIPGVVILIFPQDSGNLPMAIISFVFGGSFILISIFAMLRRK